MSPRAADAGEVHPGRPREGVPSDPSGLFTPFVRAAACVSSLSWRGDAAGGRTLASEATNASSVPEGRPERATEGGQSPYARSSEERRSSTSSTSRSPQCESAWSTRTSSGASEYSGKVAGSRRLGHTRCGAVMGWPLRQPRCDAAGSRRRSRAIASRAHPSWRVKKSPPRRGRRPRGRGRSRPSRGGGRHLQDEELAVPKSAGAKSRVRVASSSGRRGVGSNQAARWPRALSRRRGTCPGTASPPGRPPAVVCTRVTSWGRRRPVSGMEAEDDALHLLLLVEALRRVRPCWTRRKSGVRAPARRDRR